MIWCSSIALFDNAKFSWYNLIDILFINKLKCPWSSKGACVLKKGYNWKTGAHLRTKNTVKNNINLHHFKFDYIALHILLFCTISGEFLSYNNHINLYLTFEILKFENSLLLFLFQSPFYDIFNQCKQQHGTSFVYTIKNCQLCILLITLNTDNQTNASLKHLYHNNTEKKFDIFRDNAILKL